MWKCLPTKGGCCLLEWFDQNQAEETSASAATCAQQAKYLHEPLRLEVSSVHSWMADQIRATKWNWWNCCTGRDLVPVMLQPAHWILEICTRRKVEARSAVLHLWIWVIFERLTYKNFEFEMCVCDHKLFQLCLTVTCCGIASWNHKLKPVIILSSSNWL